VKGISVSHYTYGSKLRRFVDKMELTNVAIQSVKFVREKYFKIMAAFASVKILIYFYFFYCFFTIYSRYLKRVISKRDGCEYLKQVPSLDGSLELI
jgi:hypothetical protein